MTNAKSERYEEMPAHTGLPVPYIIGIVSGVLCFLLLVLLYATWRLCQKQRLINQWEDPNLMNGSLISMKERNMTISQSSPNLVNELQGKESPAQSIKRGLFKSAVRQSTLPTVSQRHLSFQRSLSHKLDLSNVEFTVQSVKHKEQPTLGKIKPELYKQASVDSIKSEHETCGSLYFSLKYDHDGEYLWVNVIKAEDLPAKDFSGTSDPYVKVYLLPDRKTKYQTKVHRKTLNPEFHESFHFSVPYRELPRRSLQFSLYDFDRFSRHDLIGDVLVRDALHDGNITKEKYFVLDIYCSHQEKVDLGEIMMSLCYLPTAGRLTVTIVKARNLKAMDIAGSSDPYVKVALMCQGKRIKKKKTSVKKNTLTPVYNEAIVFDVPQENVEDIYLVIKVIDYDRIGSNEVMGCCAVGPKYPGVGQGHWFEMLETPRKPVAQWYSLQEHVPLLNDDTPNGKNSKQRQSTVDSSDGSIPF